PSGVELDGSARAMFAIVELARLAVAEGLVHPDLHQSGEFWFAFWGATLDERVQTALTEIAQALPAVSAGAFHGDRDATVHDLYPVVVDQIARDRLVEDRVRLDIATRLGRPTALELFVDGLASPDPLLPASSGYTALH